MNPALHRYDGSGDPILHRAVLGSQTIDLPVVPVAEGAAVALLATSDVPLSFLAAAGQELADRLAPLDPDVVVTAAASGIPVGMAVARALGHDQLVVLHKTPKIHLADAYTEPLRSVTTGVDQELRLDRSRQWLIEDRRVAFVDDVIATGSSAGAALRLIRRVGGRVVALGAAATAGPDWRDGLGDDARVVHALGCLPRFRRTADGWSADDDPAPPSAAPASPTAPPSTVAEAS